MYVRAFICTLFLGIAASFDGYSAVVGLLNHRWTDICSSGLNPRDVRIYLNLTEAIGPCQSYLEVIHLPPAYYPNWLLNADCAQDCFRKRCFTNFSATYCQQVPHSVSVIDHLGKVVTYQVSIGCVCSKIPSIKVDYKPANWVS